MRMRYFKENFLFAGALLLSLVSVGAWAQTRGNDLNPMRDPRGPAELTLCSQNLDNFGLYADAKVRNPNLTLDDYKFRQDDLIRRFIKAGCDVIAVQEVLGKNDAAGEKVLALLAAVLKDNTNRYFDYRIISGSDPMLRNGFLVARDRAQISSFQSYSRVVLPQLAPEEKPRMFIRGPAEIQLAVKPREGSVAKTVAVVTFHFKSKAGSAEDPAEVEWETYRMEMAEGLRRIVESRFGQAFASGETLLVLMGDRNSEPFSASAAILEGQLILADFSGDAACRLSKHGVPLCKAGAASAQKLFSVLTRDPQVKLLSGTFSMGRQGSWLDDILMPAESLPFAQASPFIEGDYDSGIVFQPEDASDHALVWTRLNW